MFTTIVNDPDVIVSEIEDIAYSAMRDRVYDCIFREETVSPGGLTLHWESKEYIYQIASLDAVNALADMFDIPVRLLANPWKNAEIVLDAVIDRVLTRLINNGTFNAIATEIAQYRNKN